MTDTHGTGHDDGHGKGHDTGHDDGHAKGHGTGHDDGHGKGHGHAPSARHSPRRTPHGSYNPHGAHGTTHGMSASGGVSPVGLLRGTAAVAILAVVLLPFFFVIYWLTLFGTIPGDEYARFLLGLLGLPGGAIPVAPAGYRALSVLAAVPFYFSLPPLPLATAPAGMAPNLVQATAALAFLSYLSLTGTMYAAYRLARDRAGQDAGAALLAAALLFVLCWYSQFYALDPLAILLVTLGLYLLPNRYGFALLLLSAPIINEKIAIVFALWLTFRCIASTADREALSFQWATAMAAMLLYTGLIAFGHLPGTSYHLEPGSYLETLRSNFAAQLSPSGLVLNVLPITVLLGLGLIGHLGGRRRNPPSLPAAVALFRPIDLLMIPAMVVVGTAIELELEPTQLFQIGRIVMHAAPLFVIPAAAVLFRRLAGSPAAESHAP